MTKRVPAGLPARAGAGFKHDHAKAVFEEPHSVAWFEVHPENYMGEGGPALALLDELSARYALSLHGVGLGIGGEARPDRAHMDRLRTLIERVRPASFSEHLAWSSHEAGYFNDLLPLPYTNSTLNRIADHVDEVQERLGMRMLLENPSTYVLFEESVIEESAFLAEIARRTGCGLLLDINNVYVSAHNHATNATAYLDGFAIDLVGEIHLAGHREVMLSDGTPLIIDSHDRPVSDPVMTLYEQVIARTGPLPTLIEWDADLPAFDVLEREVIAANAVLDRHARLPLREVGHG